MFAILISPDTRDKIEQHDVFDPELTDLDIFLKAKAQWYFITGYVSARGEVVDWAAEPAYIFEKKFDYDADKIKTDWVQAVKKESP